MKVALINPCWDYPVTKKGGIYNRVWPPLSLANCAAMLEKEGFAVEIIDANAKRLSPEEIAKQVEGFDKIFVTSSTLDRWQCPNTDIRPFLETVRVLGNPFVIGAHGTVRPEEVLELTGAKAVIRGEPEETVLDICKADSLSKIKGITFKEDGKVISNADREPVDLDKLPMPAYHLLQVEKYHYELLGGHFMLFEASRDCPYRCIYCLKKMFKKYRQKSAEKLILEVKNATENFNVKTGYFIDLEFTLNRKLVEELCDFLIEKNYDFRWCCQTRADTVDLPLLRKMREAGCTLIHYGVETGAERVMKLIDKGISLQKIEEGIRLTHTAKIESACFFMFGLPFETREDMEKTIQFAKKINPTYASFHVVIPYPGTALFEMVKDSLGDDLFPEAYTGKFSLDELKKIKNKAFMEFYLRPGYIISRVLKGDLSSLVRQFRLFLGYIRR